MTALPVATFVWFVLDCIHVLQHWIQSDVVLHPNTPRNKTLEAPHDSQRIHYRLLTWRKEGQSLSKGPHQLQSESAHSSSSRAKKHVSIQPNEKISETDKGIQSVCLESWQHHCQPWSEIETIPRERSCIFSRLHSQSKAWRFTLHQPPWVRQGIGKGHLYTSKYFSSAKTEPRKGKRRLLIPFKALSGKSGDAIGGEEKRVMDLLRGNPATSNGDARYTSPPKQLRSNAHTFSRITCRKGRR